MAAFISQVAVSIISNRPLLKYAFISNGQILRKKLWTTFVVGWCITVHDLLSQQLDYIIILYMYYHAQLICKEANIS